MNASDCDEFMFITKKRHPLPESLLDKYPSENTVQIGGSLRACELVERQCLHKINLHLRFKFCSKINLERQAIDEKPFIVIRQRSTPAFVIGIHDHQLSQRKLLNESHKNSRKCN
ncbi:hypothetical protein JTB14_015756 [Gonioctena quinquepunctata]|nr:hypothetical protein JTB14_015756 [Gonioctena quinquepunctata]